MKNKIIKHTLAILACLGISLLMETFVFNFNTLFDNNNQRVIDLTNYAILDKEESKIITIETDNQYIEKLHILYNTSEDQIPIVIKYVYSGLYDRDIEKSLEDIVYKELPEEITSIRANVSRIEISYPANKNISIEKVTINNNFTLNYLRIIFVFGVLLIIYLFYVFWKDGFKTEKLHVYFFSFGLILGILLIVLQPAATYYSWDDQIHFENVVDFTGGKIEYSTGEIANINSTGKHIGKDSINSINEQENQKVYFNSRNKSGVVKQTNIPTFNELVYLPSALGYKLARVFNFSFVWCFKIGKVFGLLVYLLLFSYAIKISKVGKRLLVVIGLIPINLFLASEYSYDPAVMGGVTIFAVTLLNLLVDKNEKVNFKNMTIIILSILYACLAKGVYFPLLLLTWLIPNNKFRNRKVAFAVKIGLSCVAILIGCTIIGSGSMNGGDLRGGATSVSGQLSYILNYPLDYIVVLKDNMLMQFGEKFFGESSFGAFAYMRESDFFRRTLYIIMLSLIIITTFIDDVDNKLSKSQRLFILLFIVGVTALIWTALYLSFTPVGSTSIDGVQNRYFMPLLFLLLISIRPRNFISKLKPYLYNTVIFAIPIFSFLYIVYDLVLLPYCF